VAVAGAPERRLPEAARTLHVTARGDPSDPVLRSFVEPTTAAHYVVRSRGGDGISAATAASDGI